MSKLRLETPDPPDTGTTAAEEAVSAFDALVLGQPFAAEADAATEAVGTLRAAATAALFPTHVLMTANVVTSYVFFEELFERSKYAERAAALHAECLVAQPDLATFLRSGPVAARIAVAAVASAPAVSGTQDDVAARAVQGYQRTIARQLVGIASHEPAATILAVTVPALEARIDACKARHQQHVGAELSRIEGETRQAAEVIKADEVQRREGLAAYFTAQHGRAFVLKGNVLSGQALAAILRHQGAYDFSGELVKGLTLNDMMEARAREMAADAAVAAGGVQ